MTAKRKSPRRRSRVPSRGPSFGGGVLADSVTVTKAGKSSAQGIFTFFWAWAYPCDRTWHVVATIFDLPKSDVSCVLAIRKKGSPSVDPLGSISIASREADGAMTVSGPASYRFHGPGRYEVTLAFPKSKAELRIPFEIRTRGWPEFTRAELNFAPDIPASARTLRATIECPKCQAAYIFEERVLRESPLPPGVLEFPDSGVLECGGCGHEIHLRDIQGQIRQLLKERLAAAMARHP